MGRLGYRHLCWFVVAMLSWTFLGACSAEQTPAPAATSTSATQIAITPSPSTAPSPDLAWIPIRPGVEWRTIPVSITTAMVVRLDPAHVRLRVAYDPQAPKKVSDWAAIGQPLVVLNGGYFEGNNEASALTVADGVTTGASYVGFGGMLAVDEQGQIMLRSLVDRPYDSDEQLEQALQSFPRVVWNGHPTAIHDDNGRRARRTVVALDKAGRLLLLVVDTPTLTLSDLGQGLAISDLDIDRALNLDGGPSTGMAITGTDQPIVVDSHTPVPQVLVIELR